MSDALTPLQFRTLDFIASCPDGHTDLLPLHWRGRHHQQLIRRGFLRLRADPFKTKASMLRGSITVRGRAAVKSASAAVRERAKNDVDRDYAAYAALVRFGEI